MIRHEVLHSKEFAHSLPTYHDVKVPSWNPTFSWYEVAPGSGMQGRTEVPNVVCMFFKCNQILTQHMQSHVDSGKWIRYRASQLYVILARKNYVHYKKTHGAFRTTVSTIRGSRILTQAKSDELFSKGFSGHRESYTLKTATICLI
ncbi:hypothetical protein VNO77_22918 [Canavalia gladiata]|uniref:Uncharacterized protein n=1 Tax=Canavalia gladiata TaxID=3824 RepID=A0AAN9L4Y8_CANGL